MRFVWISCSVYSLLFDLLLIAVVTKTWSAEVVASKRSAKRVPSNMSSQDEGKSSPADIYMFKVNNRNNRKRCEICSKLTIKT